MSDSEIKVRDDGAGIAPDVLPQIFEPFVTTKETGLGLGLSICKRIAEAHGGEISGATRPEGGAVFTLRVPVQLSEPAACGPLTPTSLPHRGGEGLG